MKNPAAVALGRLAKGIPKNFSRAELARRKKMMEGINALRRTKTKKTKTQNERKRTKSASRSTRRRRMD
jgi:RNase H-fold protein (predicted Holliday junction resolvase)